MRAFKSHGRNSDGYIEIMENVEVHLQCHYEGLVCQHCKREDATFEIPVSGTITLADSGKADIELDLEMGGRTSITCNDCGEDTEWDEAAGNNAMRMCRDCNTIKDKHTFVHSVTGRYCCKECAHEHDMEYFGQPLID